MQGIHQHPLLEIPVEFQCQGKILLPRQPTNQRQDSSDQLARKHWFGSGIEPTGFDPRQIENIAQQKQQPLGGLLGNAQRI
ncbi:hypothetical protein PAERUG_P54_1_London_24_VIM_2_04_13_02519 [Pseudomonas aeruginosa]|nr:hypothetical protein PAERUG_P54_1_London_24_VIM_2_04_13_02519 [Pseudomonas aeruginosa]